MRRPLLVQLGLLLTLILLGFGLAAQYVLYHEGNLPSGESAFSAPSMTSEARIARIGSVILHGKLQRIEEEALLLVLREQWRQLGFEGDEELDPVDDSEKPLSAPASDGYEETDTPDEAAQSSSSKSAEAESDDAGSSVPPENLN